MVSIFLSHSWKKFRRSVSFSRETATTIFLGLIAIMFSGYLLALGFILPKIITNGLNEPDIAAFVNRLFLYYLLFEFVLRYLLQNLPVLDAQPYLHLPVKRSTIVHYLLGRSVFSVMNIFVLLLFGPMSIIVIGQEHGALVGFSWIAGLWFLSLTVHFLVVLYKVKLDDTFIGILVVVGVFALFAAADYYNWFNLTTVSAYVFSGSTSGPLFLLATLAIAAVGYLANYRVFREGLYPEEIGPKDKSQFNAPELGFLRRLGLTGEWISVETRLILRNKRPRTMFFLSIVILLYGMIFYPNPTYKAEMPGFLIFVGTFITGVFMMNYGQFLFSWQASHFDFTLTRPVSLEQFVNSKYWLLAIVTLVFFVLSIPYVYFGWDILLMNFATLLFNLGVNVYVIMNLSMWSPKRIDLTKGGAFNVQGAGAAQWLMGLPVLIGPYVFYLPLALFGYHLAGIIAIGVVGLIGIICRPYLIALTAKRLQQNRHILAEGFRKDS
ncbi:MAG TPA: DUF5687 family protein [Ohtaekwangia sp.]|nr:DUF5687 family protein [Ohtaekwangia sp.]